MKIVSTTLFTMSIALYFFSFPLCAGNGSSVARHAETEDYQLLLGKTQRLKTREEKFAFARDCVSGRAKVEGEARNFSRQDQDRVAVEIYKTVDDPSCHYNHAFLILNNRAYQSLGVKKARKKARELLVKAGTEKARTLVRKMDEFDELRRYDEAIERKGRLARALKMYLAPREQ